MITYFYAFVNDMILDTDFEQWIYEKINDIEHFVSPELFSELYECDHSCPKSLGNLKSKIYQSFEKQFENIDKDNFYKETDERLSELIKRCEEANTLKGTLVIDCTGVNTPAELQKRLCGICKFPSWYGMNWDAFNDLIDLSEVKKIEMIDFERMKKLMPHDADKLLCSLERNKSADCETEICS